MISDQGHIRSYVTNFPCQTKLFYERSIIVAATPPYRRSVASSKIPSSNSLTSTPGRLRRRRLKSDRTDDHPVVSSLKPNSSRSLIFTFQLKWTGALKRFAPSQHRNNFFLFGPLLVSSVFVMTCSAPRRSPKVHRGPRGEPLPFGTDVKPVTSPSVARIGTSRSDDRRSCRRASRRSTALSPSYDCIHFAFEISWIRAKLEFLLTI